MTYVTKEQIKASLPLEYVLAHYGHPVNQEGKALCPFHSDSDPSLQLWRGDDGNERANCFPCGHNGDVFDFITHIEGIGFNEALQRGEELLISLPDNWTPTITLTAQGRGTGPDDWGGLYLQQAQARGRDRNGHAYMAVVSGLVAEPRTTEDLSAAASYDRWLSELWGWGVDDFGSILMPHWSHDGRLVGCKVRRVDRDKQSLSGSRYTELYGAWLKRGCKSCILTEGETDSVWTYGQAAREGLNVDVYGLPAGAGKDKEITAEFIQLLAGYETVYLAFDADEAGVGSTRSWIEMLIATGFRDIRLCRLPMGKDLRDVRPSITTMLAGATLPAQEPGEITFLGGGMQRLVNADGNSRDLADWQLFPRAELVGDPRGLDVELRHRGITTEHTISLAELDGVPKIRKWASERGLAYKGNDTDTQLLKQTLLARASVLPEVFQTCRAGVHPAPERYGYAGPTLVWPGGYLGKLPWRYVPTSEAANVTGKIDVPDGTFDFDWLYLFLMLNEPAIITPLLAWLIAATRRTEFKHFPMLFIGGSSGVGKTTLAQLGQRMFGSNVSAHLGQSTPFVLMTTLASTTTFPVFVDEWTRKSRKETQITLQETIPLLYEGGMAQRGRADLSMASFRLTSPVLIAGEDSFSLDREIERMIILRPSRAGQNPEALARLAPQPIERFARLFYTWLTSRDELPQVAPSITRPEHNKAVLRAGWETLAEFLHDMEARGLDVPNLPELDLTVVEEVAREQENSYELAVREGVSLRDQTHCPLVWTDPEGRGTWVRFAMLVPAVRDKIDIELPGGHRAMKRYFEERFTLLDTVVQPPFSSERVRACLITGFDVEASV